MTWPDDERVLNRLRDWLEEVRAEADPLAEDGDGLACEVDSRPVGLYDVVAEFTALRQEVKLQTRSARSLDEQAQAALAALAEAAESFRCVQPREEQAALAAAKPFAEALADLDESLDRGRQVIRQTRQKIADSLEDSLAEIQRVVDSQPWWRRWACRGLSRRLTQDARRRAAETQGVLFDTLEEGYALIGKRLRRTMDEQQLKRIPARGEFADPRTMTVVEAIVDPERPAGLVVEELRRGYYWRGAVLRFAEVRAIGG